MELFLADLYEPLPYVAFGTILFGLLRPRAAFLAFLPTGKDFFLLVVSNQGYV